MKRSQVIQKVKKAARAQGLRFEVVELTNHTGVVVAGHRSTLGRHREIPEGTARAFWKQFECVLGEGWWR